MDMVRGCAVAVQTPYYEIWEPLLIDTRPSHVIPTLVLQEIPTPCTKEHHPVFL